MDRQLQLAPHDTIVVKVGTSTLAPNGAIDRGYIKELARQISLVRAEKLIRTILVTSAAIRSGLSHLGFNSINRTVEKQAAAAIGQPILIETYRECFLQHNMRVGQILMTARDCRIKSSEENLHNTFEQLFTWGAIPIVNENDSVAIEEIAFGDNDQLAAQVAILCGCKLAINLTDVDGFVLENGGGIISRISEISQNWIQETEYRESDGTGGMKAKLLAGRLLLERKIPMVIANGREENVIPRIIEGEAIGTLFAR